MEPTFLLGLPGPGVENSHGAGESGRKTDEEAAEKDTRGEIDRQKGEVRGGGKGGGGGEGLERRPFQIIRK